MPGCLSVAPLTGSKKGYTINKDTARMIQALYHSAAQMPTGYFEAKPERVVQYDEALAVVVPDNMDSGLMEQVKAAGMPVRTYAAGDEQSRLEAINSVEGAKFSVRETQNMAWDEQLSAYRKGKLKSSDSFYLGETPDIFGESYSGALAMNQSVYEKAKNKKHNVPNRVIKRLPELLSRPLMSFEQNGRMAVVLNDIDGAGKPLVATLRAKTPMDRITSIYGVDDWVHWVEHQGKKQIAVYDKKRAESYLQTYGSSASVEDAIHSLDKTVTHNNNFVNPQLSSRDSDGRKLTPKQQEYFADSVVRDEDGNLLVMYHGTPKGGFTQFRDWSYMTANRPYAERHADHNNKNAAVYETYVNMARPFDTRIPEIREIWENEFYDNYSRTPLQDTGLPDWTDGYDLAEFIEDNGYDYDGILLDEGADPGTNGEVVERGISYVVRSSEQIKRTDNQNPTSDPDIRYSARVYEQTDDEILSELDTSALRTQAEREAYFRWERRRAQYQAWQAKVDELQRQYDAVEDKNSQEAKNLASRIEHFMPQIERAMQQAEESRDKSRALQDVLFRTRTDAMLWSPPHKKRRHKKKNLLFFPENSRFSITEFLFSALRCTFPAAGRDNRIFWPGADLPHPYRPPGSGSAPRGSAPAPSGQTPG